MRGNSDALDGLFPDRESNEPLRHQLVRKLRESIEQGVLPPSTRLLPSRELAVRLGLSRTTVTSALEQLISEGYLESAAGSGTFVAATFVPKPPSRKPEAQPPPNARALLALDSLLRWYGDAGGRGPLRAVPDLSQFPQALWARITRRALAAGAEHLSYGSASGVPQLREAIAHHVRQFRGVPTNASQVIVVEGTQTAQRLIIDVLLREGDAVVIEDPGYNMLRASLIARRIRLEPVAVDFEGVQIADAPAALAAFVTPSHQYPLATIMSMARRRELLDWAHANDAYIVEDDYDGEFSFASKPLPTLQSLDRSRVIYVGSFSKSLAPGLRLGYLVVPPRLVEAFELARLLATFGGTRFVQATLAEFLVEGHFARHVRRLTRSHDERRRALLETLARHLPPDRFRVQGGKAGLHLAVIAPADFDDVAMSERLREHGIFTEPLSYCCVARTDCRGFIVGYSAAPPNEIAEAARRFCAIVGS